MMQVFFQTLNGRSVVKQLSDSFTLDDFIKTASEVLGVTREETKIWRFSVGGKPLNISNAAEFERNKQYITKDCNIFMLLRLLGGCNFQETLHNIAKQQFDTELDKVKTSSADCSICFDSETACIKVCCTWMCKEDFKAWFCDAMEFKAFCTICSKELVLGDIFKSPEYVATLRALEEEKLLLKNMDCQRCLDCGVLMFNETMYSRQTCKCGRVFCFFCSRFWNTATMNNCQNSCSQDCVYETKLFFDLVPFHYRSDMKIPSQRTCPRCFNLGLYDKKCKYHTCTSCKFTFCFLCTEGQSECQKKFKSSYDHACVPSPVAQTYQMFPRLAAS
ncbi:MAG: hypothetical protein J3Q66DRAFT_353143 [Benniella sp.]|nr:MAG: hypothetical protein J3Q66DRAFT_353143 [Benniella sp.]